MLTPGSQDLLELSDDIWGDVWAGAGELAIRPALAVLVATVILLGACVRPVVRRWLARGGGPSRTRVFVGLYQVLVAFAGVLLSLTFAFPSVRVADVLASLGVVSVAVGFAFKDVLENLLARALLLIRDPFKSGDQIRLGEHEGTIGGITVRETLPRTYDGQLLLIPNTQV